MRTEFEKGYAVAVCVDRQIIAMFGGEFTLQEAEGIADRGEICIIPPNNAMNPRHQKPLEISPPPS